MIDWGRVEELRAEVGNEDFSEVVDIFMEEVDEIITRLQTDPDPAQLVDDLHFLKGSALSLGFKAFATLCQQGERQATSGGPESVALAPLLEVFANSRAEFLGKLPGQTAAA